MRIRAALASANCERGRWCTTCPRWRLKAYGTVVAGLIVPVGLIASGADGEHLGARHGGRAFITIGRDASSLSVPLRSQWRRRGETMPEVEGRPFPQLVAK